MINKELIDFIKSLSKNDKKTLSQKTLKVAEELGELSKVVLPFDSAEGTHHRFSNRESILEELVDIHLANISIAYSLEFSDEEIEEMLVKKSKKWLEIQSKEGEVKFPLPYEIHITVSATEQMNESNKKLKLDLYPMESFIEEFKESCKKIGVKPIVLDLEINNESPIKDVMTSSKHIGDNKSAYEECNRIASFLEKDGFIVLRKKIETVPWHPAAPTKRTGKPIPNGHYFESHINVILDAARKEELNDFVEGLNERCTAAGRIELGGSARISKNFFKKREDGKLVNIITYRNIMTSYSKFKEEVDSITCSLKNPYVNFDFEKVEIEFAIYDTNISHDSSWINGKIEKQILEESI